MKDRLPELIAPLKLAAKGDQIEGQISLSRFGRLVPMLESSEGQVQYKLDFTVDNNGNRTIRGRIQADVSLLCQRCLKSMAASINTKVLLGIATSKEQAESLPARYEPLVLESEEISLLDIIEDEMILAMPATPMHDLSACESDETYEKYVSREKTGEKRENPFAVLAGLKTKT